LFVRLLKDLRQISVKQQVHLNENIENVSKQLTALKNLRGFQNLGGLGTC